MVDGGGEEKYKQNINITEMITNIIVLLLEIYFLTAHFTSPGLLDKAQHSRSRYVLPTDKHIVLCYISVFLFVCLCRHTQSTKLVNVL